MLSSADSMVEFNKNAIFSVEQGGIDKISSSVDSKVEFVKML